MRWSHPAIQNRGRVKQLSMPEASAHRFSRQTCWRPPRSPKGGIAPTSGSSRRDGTRTSSQDTTEIKANPGTKMAAYCAFDIDEKGGFGAPPSLCAGKASLAAGVRLVFRNHLHRFCCCCALASPMPPCLHALLVHAHADSGQLMGCDLDLRRRLCARSRGYGDVESCKPVASQTRIRPGARWLPPA